MRTRSKRAERTELPDDDELQQLITDRIDEDPAFCGTGRRRPVIVVEVDDGQATLNGVVRTRMDRRRADLLARALGATGVDNRLRVMEEGADNSDRPRSVA
jgi:osmotically-inducible protein OsmY